MKKLIIALLAKTGFSQLGVFVGYLRKSGWWKSVRGGKAVDGYGRPLPWYSYACIDFLSKRLDRLNEKEPTRKLQIFEYGSGQSTLWWAQHASFVTSVEDNSDWYEYIKGSGLSNVKYILEESEADYISRPLKEQRIFDLIIIDGSYREACVNFCLQSLAKDGVVVMDNSDWPELKPSRSRLSDLGFREIEFASLGPANGHPWSTSIFYRDDNIFAI